MKSAFVIIFTYIIIINVVRCYDGQNVNGTISKRTTKYLANIQDEGTFFRLLEDYATRKPGRMAKFVPSPTQYMPPSSPSQNQYQSPNQQYMTPSQSGFYITKRIGEAMELEPHMRPPGKVISPPNGPPNYNPTRQAFIQNQPLREVSETDLYLLGAIEKLVFRVDYLEHRVRRSEQLIYYLMAGNKQKEVVPDPCPANFSRIGENCYHLEGDRQVNWKTANGICKSLGANLAEFENISENEDMIAYLLNHPSHRGKDFWLGGLNPGLLWIWSNSAKPVNPNTNLTFVASFASDNSVDNNNGSEKIINNDGPQKIVNNSSDIKGSGRCLRLSYNPTKHTYFYFGQECTTRHHFLCEYREKTLENKIKKISRDLDLDWL